MTRRSVLLVFMAVILVGLTVVSRGPRSRSRPVMTDTPVSVHREVTAAPVKTVEVGRDLDGEDLPRYTDSDRAGVVAYVDGRFDEALDLFSQAVANDPRDAESFSNLGQVLARLGRHEEAVQRFEQAIAINPSRWAYHFNMAHALGEAGQWDRAITQYQRASELSPTEYVTHYNLGRALHERGRDEDAIAAYGAALDLNPADPSFHLSLGVSYEALRLWDDALSAYQTYLELAPASPKAEALKWHVAAILEEQEREQGPARAG